MKSSGRFDLETHGILLLQISYYALPVSVTHIIFFVHLFKVVDLSVFSFIRVSIEIYIDLPLYDHMLNVFKVKLLP